MTQIVGEGFLVTTRPTGFDGVALTPDDGIEVKLWIRAPSTTNEDGEEVVGDFVVAAEPMTYDAAMSFTDSRVTRVGWWYYLWDSAGETATGTYKGKAVVTGPDGIVSFEDPVRIRLAANKMPTS